MSNKPKSVRRLLFAMLFMLCAAPVFAQTAGKTLALTLQVDAIHIERACVCGYVVVSYVDPWLGDTRSMRFEIPADPLLPGTEVASFVSAIVNVRATETGSNTRKLNFRVLGYLSDQARLGGGVTLVP